MSAAPIDPGGEALLHLKSLRHRVLLLFAILAVGPLLAFGLLDYSHARHAVERIIIARTDAGAKRAVELIADRYALVESDAGLLSNNAETQELFTQLGGKDSSLIARALASADTFARVKWAQTRGAYQSLELRDTHGTALIRLLTLKDTTSSGVDTALASGVRPGANGDTITGNSPDLLPPIVHPIMLGGTSRRVGDVVLQPVATTLLPAQLSGLSFGRAGYLLIIDSAAQHVLYDSRRPGQDASLAGVFGLDAVAKLTAARAAGDPVRYSERDSARLASSEVVQGLGWTVLSSAALPEFTAGINDGRALDLALVLVIAAAVAIAFTFFIARSTRSLEELTLAAGAVGRGDLSPHLPPVSDDEVGTLSGAFDQMLARIRTMLREIEVSRQLAVLGEFSAQLSHEIRNPLTSLKLNLQGLSRDVRRGRLPEDAGPPVDICLREVNRLDGVVRGVLDLARPRSTARGLCTVHTLLDRVVDLHSAQLMASGITLVRDFGASRDRISCDTEQLVGLFNNLVVNAIDAQPGGGRVLLRTTNDDQAIEILVADDGPGAPAELADRIFSPFVSGKTTGTGLGLPMALNAAREHGGTLDLTPTPEGFLGATFKVTLPLL